MALRTHKLFSKFSNNLLYSHGDVLDFKNMLRTISTLNIPNNKFDQNKFKYNHYINIQESRLPCNNVNVHTLNTKRKLNPFFNNNILSGKYKCVLNDNIYAYSTAVSQSDIPVLCNYIPKYGQISKLHTSNHPYKSKELISKSRVSINNSKILIILVANI